METTVDPADFKAAMSRFASGVTVCTTLDREGKAWGFTASAFSSLSLNPPLILVCLDKGAECFEAFEQQDTMGVSILSGGQNELAMRFATRGADKFSGGIEPGAATAMPVVTGALAQVECRIKERLEGGDHVILVGEVVAARVTDDPPLLHYNRAFGDFVPYDS
jgi:flavin reductase ActVB